MELHKLFKKYQKYVVKQYLENNDWMGVQYDCWIFTIDTLIGISCIVALNINRSFSLWLMGLYLIIGFYLLFRCGKKRGEGQNYDRAVEKRNILCWALLKECEKDIEGDNGAEVKKSVEKFYGNGDAVFYIVRAIIVGIYEGLALIKQFNIFNLAVLFGGVNSKDNIYVPIAVLLLGALGVWGCVIFLKSEKGQKLYFKNDLIDVITFQNRAKQEYEKYVHANFSEEDIRTGKVTLEQISKKINLSHNRLSEGDYDDKSIVTCWKDKWDQSEIKKSKELVWFGERLETEYYDVVKKADENRDKNFQSKKMFLATLIMTGVLGTVAFFRYFFIWGKDDKLAALTLGGTICVVFCIWICGAIAKWIDTKKYQETWTRHRSTQCAIEREMMKYICEVEPYNNVQGEKLFVKEILKIEEVDMGKFAENMENKESSMMDIFDYLHK